MFENDEKLTEFDINETVTSVGYHAFSGTGILSKYSAALKVYKRWVVEFDTSSSTASVIIVGGDNGTVGICDYAFADALNVTSVSLPPSIKIIGKGAFSGCVNLAKVTYSFGTMEEFEEIAIAEGNDNLFNSVIKCKDGDIDRAFTTAPYDDDHIIIEEYYGNAETVRVPETINGKTVIAIGASAFANNTTVKTIILPDTIETIGAGAFKFSTLESITLPDGLKSIGNYAFQQCNYLSQVNIPDTVTYVGTGVFTDTAILTAQSDETLKVIDNWIVDVLSDAKSVAIPAGIVGISAGAFMGCASLTSVSCPATLLYIGDNAFNCCEKLSGITLGSNVKRIENGTFGDCSVLSSITLPENLEYIGNEAFANTALSNITIPESVTGIGYDAFLSTPMLTSQTGGVKYADNWLVSIDVTASGEVTVKDGIVGIADSAAQSNPNITSVTMPDSVKYISAYAFADCENLESVSLSNSTVSIGENAFADCTSLADLYYNGSADDFYKIDGIKTADMCGLGNCTDLTVHFADFDWCTYYSYKFSDNSAGVAGYNGNGKDIVLPEYTLGELSDGTYGKVPVTSVGYNAFTGNTVIESVVIPDTYTTLGSESFRNCSNLRSVVIGDGIVYVLNSTFYNCSSLESVTFGKNIRELAYGAFEGCALTSVTLPESLTYISDNVFYGCPITSIVIPDKVEAISGQAFAYTNLESITLGKGLTYIVHDTFEGTPLINDQTTPVKYVNTWAVTFDGSVDTVEIKPGTTAIADSAFSYSEIVSVTLPDSLKLICEDAFSNSHNLTAIVIPDSVETIEYCAFEYCYSLKDVTIGSSVKYIGSYAFEGTAIESVKLPASLEHIGYKAFNGTPMLEEQTGDLIYADNWLIYGKDAEGSVTVKDGTVGIANYAFEYSEITEVIMPKTVKYIGEDAFYDCEELVNAVMPGVTIIEDDAFYICYKLASATLSEGLITIGDNAFGDCHELLITDIPGSVTSIGLAAFSGTKTLSDADENTVVYIGKWLVDTTFENETILPALTIKDGTVGIAGAALYSVRIGELTIPDSVKYICEGVFYSGDIAKKINYAGTESSWKKIIIADEYNDGLLAADITTIPTPAKVTGVKLSGVTDTSVTLSWDKSANAAGYKAEQYVNGAWKVIKTISGADTTTLTVSSLTAGTAYKFRIRAYVNKYSKDFFGAYSAELSAATNPSQVTGLAVSAKTDTTVTLKWTKNTSGTGYKIEKYNAAAKKWETVATITSSATVTYQVKGLTAGTTYKFRVCAVKGTQSGAYSAELSAMTYPSKITSLTASAKADTTVTLKWAKNTSGTGYKVEKYNAASKAWETVTTVTSNATVSYKVTGLKASTTYKFRVCAINGTLSGAYSTELSVTTNPSKVSGLKADTKTDTTITIKWTKNTSGTGYKVEKYNASTQKWEVVATLASNATVTYMVSGLKASTTYKFRVCAIKGEQSGAYSTELSATTNPSKVTNLTASTRTDTTITLKWDKNTSGTGYTVQQYKSGKWTTIKDITKNTTVTLKVTGLKAGTTYKFRVRAVKGTQSGAYSTTLSAATKPSKVTGLKASAKTTTSITLKWDKNTSGAGYTIQQYKSGKWTTIKTITKNSTVSFKVTGLKAGTQYKFKVCANKSGQSGAYSSTLTVYTNPSKVTGLKASAKTKTSITLKWNKNTGGTGYEIQQYKNGKWTTIKTISKNSTVTYKVTGLKAGTQYKFRVRACRGTQYGAYSATLTASTTK